MSSSWFRIAAFCLSLSACAPDLNRPQPVAWDREACSSCGMLVSDPHTAAQLVTREGKVYQFDDPGCLFKHMADHHPVVKRIWFRDSQRGGEEAWLAWEGASFLPGQETPMGSGLYAVPLGSPGSISFSEASNRVLTAWGR